MFIYFLISTYILYTIHLSREFVEFKYKIYVAPIKKDTRHIKSEEFYKVSKSKEIKILKTSIATLFTPSHKEAICVNSPIYFTRDSSRSDFFIFSQNTPRSNKWININNLSICI